MGAVHGLADQKEAPPVQQGAPMGGMEAPHTLHLCALPYAVATSRARLQSMPQCAGETTKRLCVLLPTSHASTTLCGRGGDGEGGGGNVAAGASAEV